MYSDLAHPCAGPHGGGGRHVFYGRAVGEVFGHDVKAGGKNVTVDDLDGGRREHAGATLT